MMAVRAIRLNSKEVCTDLNLVFLRAFYGLLDLLEKKSKTVLARNVYTRMISELSISLFVCSTQAFKGTELMIDDQTVTTPKGSVRTVRGCRCKRSRCLKKYCECYGVGLKCGENCICEECQNGNELGGPSSVTKKAKSAVKSKPTKSAGMTVHVPQAVALKNHKADNKANSNPPILNKPQFKTQPVATVALTGKVQSFQARKPPLSVHIPQKASETVQVQVAPVQRDVPTFDRRESSTAWAMTPLGGASGWTPVGGSAGWSLGSRDVSALSATVLPVPEPMDRENSGFPLYSNQTPTGGMQRDFSGIPTFHAQWDTDAPSARGMRSLWAMSPIFRDTSIADSPKALSMLLMTPRSPLQPLRPGAGAGGPLPSPSVAIFTAAENMCPVLSPSVDDLTVSREVSSQF